jgi:transcriptional regulator with XRE-family HTH domain
MRIRERRTLLGMTQAHFAAAIGTTHQQVSRYETGITRVAAGVLYQIAQAIGVDVGYFFEGLDQTVDPTGRLRTWTALRQDVMNIPDLKHRRAFLRLARVMAGSGQDDDGDQGQGEA